MYNKVCTETVSSYHCLVWRDMNTMSATAELSHFKTNTNFWGVLLQYRFWFGKSGVEPEILHFYRDPYDADVGCPWLWVERVTYSFMNSAHFYMCLLSTCWTGYWDYHMLDIGQKIGINCCLHFTDDLKVYFALIVQGWKCLLHIHLF